MPHLSHADTDILHLSHHVFTRDHIAVFKGKPPQKQDTGKKFSNMSLKANPIAIDTIPMALNALVGVRPGNTTMADSRIPRTQMPNTANRLSNFFRDEGMQKVLSVVEYDLNGLVAFTNCFDQLAFGRTMGFTVMARLSCV